ncbi:hypothetical protein AMAG_04081 [Allomyces macrogynus ATCC 38327]|uniref:Calponin-homology (CH) domain-containing protein n=1 Tax=Allomyces macrogynus (strain ATCC 38327) TaxID=578462 RepID=A0A0L0S7G0_ALLM3|nr:hypothetical protein AMAG_04081 [Allomyces macrogynus ATCC 38327]|eukprot:KNE58513.1 hypothetical protein AMAG_04081 [Allomyces macrogynus ATCC 38327]
MQRATLLQKKTFTKWVNAKLAFAKAPYGPVQELSRDLRDGLRLLALVRALAPPSQQTTITPHGRTVVAPDPLAPERHTVLRIHHIVNVGKALKYVERVTGASLPNLGPEDVVDGNLKLTLGLIWALIVRFQLASVAAGMGAKRSPRSRPTSLAVSAPGTPTIAPAAEGKGGDDASGPAQDAAAADEGAGSGEMTLNEAQQSLLRWVAVQIEDEIYKPYVPNPPTDFSSCWQNGVMFMCLVHSTNPDLVDLTTLDTESTDKEVWRKQLATAFQLAESDLGIPSLLEPEDLVEYPDEKSIMTYVSGFYVAMNAIRERELHPLIDDPVVAELEQQVADRRASMRRTSVLSSATTIDQQSPPTPSLVQVDTSSTARDLRAVVAELSGLKRAVKRVAMDYPDWESREAALHAAITKLAVHRDDFYAVIEREAGIAPPPVPPKDDAASSATAAEGGDAAPAAPAPAPAPATPTSPKVPASPNPSQAQLNLDAERLDRVRNALAELGPAAHALAVKGLAYCDDIQVMVKRHQHSLSLERLIQDFYEDCDACNKWISDSSLSLLLQTKKVHAFTMSETNLQEFVALMKEIQTWSGVMDKHLGEFSGTLNALQDTAQNLLGHVGDGAWKNDQVFDKVRAREREVMAAWRQFSDDYTALKAHCAPLLGTLALLTRAFKIRDDVQHMATELKLAVGSSTTTTAAADESADAAAGPDLSGITNAASAEFLSSVVHTIDKLQPKLVAAQADVVTLKEKNQATLDTYPPVATFVTSLDTLCATTADQFTTTYRTARLAALTRDWATAQHYVKQVADSLPQLSVKDRLAMTGASVPTDGASPKRDEDVLALLTNAAAAIASTGTTLNSYETRVLNKLEAKTTTHAADLTPDQATQIQATVAQVMGQWRDAMALFAKLRAEAAEVSWVADAARALAKLEFRLTEVTTTLGMHINSGGNRRSMVTASMIEGGTVLWAPATPAPPVAAAALAQESLPGVQQTLDDLQVDLDQFVSAFPAYADVAALQRKYTTLSSSRDKAQRILGTLMYRQKADVQQEQATQLATRILDELNRVATQVKLEVVEVAQVPDPLTATGGQEPATITAVDFAQVTSTLDEARASLRQLQDDIAGLHQMQQEWQFTLEGAIGDQIKTTLDAVTSDINTCAHRVSVLQCAQAKIKDFNDWLDRVERLLHGVEIPSAVDPDSDEALDVVIPRVGDESREVLGEAGTALKARNEADVPAPLVPRFRALQRVHGLFARHVQLADALAEVIDGLEPGQLFSLDPDEPNKRIPTREEYLQHTAHAEEWSAKFGELSDKVSAWVDDANAFLAGQESASDEGQQQPMDEAALFATPLGSAKTHLMQASMDTSDAIDKHQFALGLLQRVIDTDVEGRKLLAEVEALAEGSVEQEETVVSHVEDWSAQSADLHELYLPLQALDAELVAAVERMRGRLAVARGKAVAMDRLAAMAQELKRIKDTVVGTSAVGGQDLYSLEAPEIDLLNQVVSQSEDQIDALRVELLDVQFQAVQVDPRYAATKSTFTEVEADVDRVKKTAARAHRYRTTQATVRSLHSRIQAALDALAGPIEGALPVTGRDAEVLDNDLSALMQASTPGLSESSPLLASALEALQTSMGHLRESLAEAQQQAHLKALAGVFDAAAADIVKRIDSLQEQLTQALHQRGQGTAVLEDLDAMASELDAIKADVADLIPLGSGNPELAGSVHMADIRGRESALAASLTALGELYATVASAKRQERKVATWHLKHSQITSTMTGLLEQYKALATTINLDTVDEAQTQAAELKSRLDAALVELALLKKEAQGDVTTLSTLSLLLNRKATQVQQALDECVRIKKLTVQAEELKIRITEVSESVGSITDTDTLMHCEQQLADYEDELKKMVEIETMFVITSDSHQDLVQGLFTDLQMALTLGTSAVESRRKVLDEQSMLEQMQTMMTDLKTRIHDTVAIEFDATLTKESHAELSKQYSTQVRAASSGLEQLREQYDALTAKINSSLGKIQDVAKLHGLVASVAAEWTRAREAVKVHTEAAAAHASLSELYGRLMQVEEGLVTVKTGLDDVRANTNESCMSTIQQLTRDFAPLRDELAVVQSVYGKLMDREREREGTTAAQARAGTEGIKGAPLQVDAFEADLASVAATVADVQAKLAETQGAVFKASQVLAAASDLLQQAEVMIETARERYETMSNDLFYSMDLVDAELFVKAALTVHQNANGDIVRLKGARERLQTDDVLAMDAIADSFKDRIRQTVRDLTQVTADMDAAVAKEVAQVELLKKVYSHMRATNQILVWLTAAKGAMATLTNVTQIATIDEVRGKLTNFTATIEMYVNMSKELAQIVDNPVVTSRTERVTQEWHDLNEHVDMLANHVVQDALFMEFHALCDEMEELMQLFRRQVQTVSRDAEQVENEDDHDEMLRQLRQMSVQVSESLDPQVARLAEILDMDQIKAVEADVLEELTSRRDAITAQAASLQDLIAQRTDLIQATQQARAAFQIFGEISKLMNSCQSLLEEIKVDQVALLDIDRTISALQQRHSQYAGNVDRLFDLVDKMPLRDQVASRRAMLAQQWGYVNQDLQQMTRDLELRKKLLLARMEREREDGATSAVSGGSATRSPAPGAATRSFLPRPTSPGAPLRAANSGIPSPSRLPTPARIPTPGGYASNLRPKTPPASRLSRTSKLHTPPPPVPTIPSGIPTPSGIPAPTSGLPTPGFNNGRASRLGYTPPKPYTPTPQPPTGFLVPRASTAPKRIFYRPDPSDPIDVRLAEVVNELGVFVKIKRMGPGRYHFGDIEGKVVNCKLINQNLLVRVGGGWKDFREYVLESDMIGLVVKSESVLASRINYQME